MNAPGDQALEVTPHPLLLQESDAPSKSKSSSSSSSSTSSSSSSEEEEDSDLDAKRGPRGRETHPVPQKKAQILVAKPELKDPIRKKRGRKPKERPSEEPAPGTPPRQDDWPPAGRDKGARGSTGRKVGAGKAPEK